MSRNDQGHQIIAMLSAFFIKRFSEVSQPLAIKALSFTAKAKYPRFLGG